MEEVRNDEKSMIKKRASQFLLWVTIGVVLVKLRSIVFVKIFSNVISPEALGHFYFIFNNSIILSTIIVFNMTEAIFRFSSEAEYKDNENSAFTVLISGIILSIGIGAIMNLLLLGSAVVNVQLFTSDNYLLDIMLMGVFGVIVSIDSLLLFFYRSKQEIGKHFSLEVIIPLLTLTLSIVLGIWFNLSSLGLIIAHLVGYALLVIPYTGKILHSMRGQIFNFDEMVAILKFSFPGFLVSLALSVKLFLLNLLLKEFHGNEAVAIFNIAVSIANILALIDYIIGAAYPTVVMRNYDLGNHDYIRSFTNRITRIYMGIFITIALIVSALTPFLVIFFSSQEYTESGIIVPILIFGFVIQTLRRITCLGPILEKRPDLASIRGITANIIHLIILILLVPVFGALGVAISNLLFNFIFFLLRFHLSQKLYPIPYDKGKFAAMFLSLLLSLVIGVFFSFSNELFFVNFVVSSAVFVVLILVFRLVTINEVNDLFRVLVKPMIPSKIGKKLRF